MADGKKREREREKGKGKKKKNLTCEIVSNKRNADVDEIIKPSRHDGGAMISNDFDEFALKELISIKENVVSKPCSGSGNQSRPKICKGESERVGIVSGYLALPLRCGQLLTGGLHLICSVVDEPEGSNSWDGKGDAVSPLCGQGRIRWVPTSVMEAEKEENQEDLVEELAPALHQEGARHFTASMETVLFCRDFARADGVFHPACRCHRIFAADADSVEEEGPNVADNPSILG